MISAVITGVLVLSFFLLTMENEIEELKLKAEKCKTLLLVLEKILHIYCLVLMKNCFVVCELSSAEQEAWDCTLAVKQASL